jgi:type I restriction enzyme R subunit
LVDQIAQGRRDDDGLSSLAGRLSALDHRLDVEDRERVTQATGGKSIRALARTLLDAIDLDIQAKTATDRHGQSPTEGEMKGIAEELIEAACRPFDDPKVRQLLKDIKQKSDIVIDEITTDEITSASYDLRQAEERIRSFKEFIEQYKDELTALQILYNQPYGREKLTYAAIKELAQKLTDPPYYLATADVWQAYKRLDATKVRGAPVDQQLTEIVSLVRYALGIDTLLEPFGVKVEQRFNLWVGREKNQGRDYTAEQIEWLRSIASFIGANAEIAPRDLQEMPNFADKGGLFKARELFGPHLNELLDGLQHTLVA